MWRTPNLLKKFKCEFEMKIVKEWEVEARSLTCNTSGVKGVLELQDGIRKIDKHFITHIYLHKTKQVD